MSLKITLEYISEIDHFNNKPLNFNENLKKTLSKVSDTSNELHTWVNEDLTENLIQESLINLRIDSTKKRVLSVITYTLEKEPSTLELEKIVDSTTAQLSDGYGEEPLEIILSNKILYKNKIYIGLLGHFQTYPIKIEKVIDYKTSIIYKKIECSLAIIGAVEQGNLELVSSYLNTQDIVDCKITNDDSLLIYAITKRQEEIAFFLIKNGADISNMNKILSYSCYAGLIELTTFLLNNGADVNAIWLNERTPLLWAGNNLDMVKLLVLRGADVNTQNDYGRSALSLSSNPNVVEFLLSKGANPNHKSDEGKAVLDYFNEDLAYAEKCELISKYKKIIKILNDYNKPNDR
ncbi:ankyrin repeat domain-containing protein [Winogradskyella sp.]|nr:ankyrin repeat domain-containing protein [Winogradskyella sp.]